MTTSSRSRVRRHEEARKARGERSIKLWLPDDDKIVRRFREHAARVCKAVQAQQAQSSDTNAEQEDQPS